MPPKTPPAPTTIKVFISWSGDYAKDVALALRKFLKGSLQATEPWVSAKDIEAGLPWFDEIRSNLAGAAIGVICCTADKVARPWLNFEAGAIAMAGIDRRKTIPYCIDIAKEDIGQPLGLLHAVQGNRDGTLEMFRSINNVLNTPLSTDMVEGVFDKWWPDLEKDLAAAKSAEQARRPGEDIEPKEPDDSARLKRMEEALLMLVDMIHGLPNDIDIDQIKRAVGIHTWEPRGSPFGVDARLAGLPVTLPGNPMMQMMQMMQTMMGGTPITPTAASPVNPTEPRFDMSDEEYVAMRQAEDEAHEQSQRDEEEERMAAEKWAEEQRRRREEDE